MYVVNIYVYRCIGLCMDRYIDIYIFVCIYRLYMLYIYIWNMYLYMIYKIFKCINKINLFVLLYSNFK